MKNSTLIISGLLALLAVGGAGFGVWNFIERDALSQKLSISQGRVHELEKKSAEFLDSDTKDQVAIPFDIATVKVGDRIGEMTVVSINQFTKKTPLGPYNAVVTFKGAATIKGSWDRRAFGDDKVCMTYMEETSKALLPLMKGDTRAVWFCFDNNEDARKEFGPLGASGTATVSIDDYSFVSAEVDVWNSATLVKVLEKTYGYTNEKYGFHLAFPKETKVQQSDMSGFAVEYDAGPVRIRIDTPSRTLDEAVGKIGDASITGVEKFSGHNSEGRLVKNEDGEISAVFIKAPYEYRLSAMKDAYTDPAILLKVFSSFTLFEK